MQEELGDRQSRRVGSLSGTLGQVELGQPGDAGQFAVAFWPTGGPAPGRASPRSPSAATAAILGAQRLLLVGRDPEQEAAGHRTGHQAHGLDQPGPAVAAQSWESNAPSSASAM